MVGSLLRLSSLLSRLLPTLWGLSLFISSPAFPQDCKWEGVWHKDEYCSAENKNERSNIADADGFFAQGNAEMRAGNYQNAVDAYKRAWTLSYRTVHFMYGHQLRDAIKPNLEAAEEALKAQRQGRALKSTALLDPDEQVKSRFQREEERKRQDELMAKKIRESLSQLAVNLSSTTPVNVGLDFVGHQQDTDSVPLAFAGSPKGNDGIHSARLAFLDRAQLEQQKKNQEDLEFSRKYSPDKINVPPPQIVGREIRYNGIKVSLSDQASGLVRLVQDKTEHLPLPTRQRIRDFILEYMVKHSLPEYGQDFKAITFGTADDFKSLLEAIKSNAVEIAYPAPSVGTRIQVAADAIVPNTGQRIYDTARDKAVSPIKDAVEQLARPSDEAAENSARDQIKASIKNSGEKAAIDEAIDYIKDALEQLVNSRKEAPENSNLH